MISWCILPYFTSVHNELGAYDGVQASVEQFVDDGIPYIVGRLYFGNYPALKDLGLGMLIGALVILPLVVVELKMSPQMHTWIYGWYPHSFAQTIRDGGYRPSVFMSHGLELAIWNSAAAFMGWQMYLRKTITKEIPIIKIRILPAIIILTLVFLRSHSSGAIALFLIAMIVYEMGIRLRTTLPILALCILPILYVSLRGSGAWDGQNFIQLSEKVTGSADRASSLEYRMLNENLLSEKAREHLLVGWGRFGRNFIKDEEGKIITVADGRWIIVFGENGIIGLSANILIMTLPAVLFFLKIPSRLLRDPVVAPAAVFATFLLITLIDNLFNNMGNPVLIISCGGLSTLVMQPRSNLEMGQAPEKMTIPPVPAIPTRVI